MKSIIVISILFFLSCTSSRQGRVIQGKDGKIESAIINAKCTPPSRSYATDIDAKLKAEMDSLRFTPKASFDASFQQKIVKLKEYSSLGLDLDLLCFRICEMSNNRGFTSEQTMKLISDAINIWGQKNLGAGISQTVISNNQQGGITAGNVFVGAPSRQLDNGFKSNMRSFLATVVCDSIEVGAILGNYEAFQFAEQIHSYLKHTFPGIKVNGISQYVPNKVLPGVLVDTGRLSKERIITIQVGPSKE